VLILDLGLPGMRSLKQKRSKLLPLLARLHREFNASTAEIDLQDQWQRSIIACAVVSNDHIYNQKFLQNILNYTESHFPDILVNDHRIELL
jgi:uncharacterized protein